MRWVLHADMDAFYASVEQRDHPELRGKPVIIGAQSARGVVAAASYEARVFGVHSAMPGFQARKLCPHGVFLGGDMKKYARVSRQVHAVFTEFTDQIEPLALDEAFLDITGSTPLLGSPSEIGHKLKLRVREETELAVSVGIGPNKLVAKIACSQGKPDGLMLVPPDQVTQLLAPLPLRALFGVGPKTEQRLLELGLQTVGDLAAAAEADIRRQLGEHGTQLVYRARGIDDRPVISGGRPRSIGEESTFPDDVLDPARISAAITSHAETVASRARRAGYVGGTVALKVKLARRRRLDHGGATGGNTNTDTPRMAHHELFPQLTRQKRLPQPTADGAEMRRVCLELWRKLDLREPIRLLGVTLSQLQPAEGSRQLDLFAPVSTRTTHAAPTQRERTLSRGEALGHALDAISERYGASAIRRAAEAPDKVTASDKAKLGDIDPADEEP